MELISKGLGGMRFEHVLAIARPGYARQRPAIGEYGDSHCWDLSDLISSAV